MMRSVTVLATGALTTVQDIGRPGQAALGVGRSGACDRVSYRLANRLVGNAEDAAVLEVTFGGLHLRADADVMLATTGARCAGTAPHNAPFYLRTSQELRLGPPDSGLRTYVAVRGGFAADPVLGSRSTDVLSGLGPAEISAGDVLDVGGARFAAPGVDVAPVPDPADGDVTVRVVPRPRREWVSNEAWDLLGGPAHAAPGETHHGGARRAGEPLQRTGDGEAPTQGTGPG